MSSPPLVIAKAEVRRSVRVTREDRTKLLTLVAIALFLFVPGVVGGAFVGFFGARALRGSELHGTEPTLVAFLSAAVGFFWLFLALFATIRTTTQVGDLDEPEFLLLGTTSRNVVLGLLTAEWVRFGSWLVPASVIVSTATSLGARAPWPLFAAVATTALIGLTAIPAGFLLGCAIRHALTVYHPVAKLRVPIFLGLLLGYVTVIVVGWMEGLLGRAFQIVGDSPLGWFSTMLFAGLPGIDPDFTQLMAMVVLSVTLAPLLIVGCQVIAKMHWYSDPVPRGKRRFESRFEASRQLARFLGRPASTICVTTIRRTRRAPVRGLYVAYPMLGGLFLVAEILRVGYMPIPIAYALCLYVAWGMGALFTLNPLGDLGPVQSVIVTSTITGRTVMTGYLLAAGVVGLPLGTSVAIVAGWISPLNATGTILLILLAGSATIIAPALALGVGTLFPRYGRVAVTHRREAVMPSKLSFVVYSSVFGLLSVAIILTAVPDAAEVAVATLSATAELAGVRHVELAVTALRGGMIVVIGLTLLLGAASVRFAVSQFEALTVE